eukprot:TRINITY_DN4593_c0_g1_i1.p1 TRINITY_DN4593_c0_g1~~TRINITY_DN4593_c0_g1_i1.p1  ORF type:complete len:314 (+),score=49.69 TRINITY_DN4593_c0_g1_i1:644-1585(+)
MSTLARISSILLRRSPRDIGFLYRAGTATSPLLNRVRSRTETGISEDAVLQHNNGVLYVTRGGYESGCLARGITLSSVPKWDKAVWRTISPIIQLPIGLDLMRQDFDSRQNYVTIVPTEDMPLQHYTQLLESCHDQFSLLDHTECKRLYVQAFGREPTWETAQNGKLKYLWQTARVSNLHLAWVLRACLKRLVDLANGDSQLTANEVPMDASDFTDRACWLAARGLLAEESLLGHTGPRIRTDYTQSWWPSPVVKLAPYAEFVRQSMRHYRQWMRDEVDRLTEAGDDDGPCLAMDLGKFEVTYRRYFKDCTGI